MSFAWPWLFLALPLPWALRLLLPPPEGGPALRIPRLPDTVAQGPRARTQGWLAVLAWLLLVTAAARPQMPGDLLPVRGGSGMIIAFDVSSSMSVIDLKQGDKAVERLHAARALAGDFLARRQGDRAGLVVFGAQAYLHTPLTHDLHAVRAALASVQAGLAGRETALGDAIALSVKYLKELPENARVLVLLTDGANTAGTLAPGRAAWLARREGVRIHAVGVGSGEGLQETVLKDMTVQTGGSYVRATDSRAIAAFFDGVQRAEPAARESEARALSELYAWPLALACLLAAGLAWHHRREAMA
ncbi:VWA domain-containing protein [Noviherbaspirillum sp. ST9]|uniref:VWA domain-containing protein n=1 Tax=Noviherbaspirillum sp. ST9 TaxID=3401606 RepID=UPI003B58895A